MIHKHLTSKERIRMMKAFKNIQSTINDGVPLNLSMIGDVFGQPFWQLLVLCQSNLTIDDAKNITFNIVLPK